MNARELFAAIDPFRSLAREDRNRIIHKLRRREFQAGDLLMSELSWIDSVGFLASGRADVYLGWRTPSQKKVYSVYPGDFFGDLTCLTERKSFVTIVCRETSIVYLRSYDDFMRSLEAHDRLKIHFLRSAVDKLWRFFQVVVNNGGNAEITDLPGAHLPGPIKKALQYIDDHYEEPLTVSLVCQVAGMSKSAFSRQFKQCMGTSFKNYLNRLRVSKAKWLISQEGLNVTEACFTVGFNDVAYFSRTFRKIEGRSPSHHKNGPKFANPPPQ
jgi:AraC-like DNA-binding protein